MKLEVEIDERYLEKGETLMIVRPNKEGTVDRVGHIEIKKR